MIRISGPAIIAVISAIAMIGTALITQLGTFRTSQRSARAQRESAIDIRVDAQMQALAARYDALGDDYDRLAENRDRLLDARDKAIHERDEYREQWVAMRVVMRQIGLDPDKVLSGGQQWSSTARPDDGTTSGPTTPS